MIPDEYLIWFRLQEAARHLQEAEALIPENTERRRFLLAAQVAVKAVQDEAPEE